MSINNAYISKSKNAVKSLYSITPFTLLDYPDKTACILWFAGCNMRCAYCYNPEIVFGKGKIDYAEALKFIRSRVNLLDAVVLSGGECTMHKGLTELIKEIKDLGLLVKIDTNGSHPKLIKELVSHDLVNFISLDFKAPAYKFYQITRSHLYKKFKETLEFLVNTSFPFEVRTTIHSDLIQEDDLQSMLSCLEKANYTGKYFLQNYMEAPQTIGNMGPSLSSYLPFEKYSSTIGIEHRN